ncbi:SGNH/GDSL hydrolase family protein [Streptomonospora wellingtoniae]|uniref:SGNH/GDSL hydrolase family protein n=1 Tax=Streptomonospora wellingtoniae TaxID=3075544 RepID=A0ABU2KSL5_9ACTN|nr:SGNH/GDSL hydrolase family protein [Streptomonospora sp. DSM 45055]MDT0302093.1 SGNH/GDSL hydrolase family protein [Streptomonospora sp. DSM 45055]
MNPLDWDRRPLNLVALGDSFTEGVGDPYPPAEPGAPVRYRGWADRFAEHLAAHVPELRYANLAVRGKLMRQIVEDQLARAVGLAPDLVTLSAGGNDLLRPGGDPDRLARVLERAVRRLRGTGADVVLFTGINFSAGFMRLRIGTFARYYLNIRAIADRHGCHLVDQWSMDSLTDRRAWDADRLHMSPEGHRRLAAKVAETVGLPVERGDDAWPPAPPPDRRAARRADARWAREHLVPWVGRRLTGRSSGDGVTAKRPELEPFAAEGGAGARHGAGGGRERTDRAG